jgi:hypothetical protein
MSGREHRDFEEPYMTMLENALENKQTISEYKIPIGLARRGAASVPAYMRRDVSHRQNRNTVTK